MVELDYYFSFKTTLCGHILKKSTHSLFGAMVICLVHLRSTASEGPIGFVNWFLKKSNHGTTIKKGHHRPWSDFMVHGVNWPFRNTRILTGYVQNPPLTPMPSNFYDNRPPHKYFNYPAQCRFPWHHPWVHPPFVMRHNCSLLGVTSGCYHNTIIMIFWGGRENEDKRRQNNGETWKKFLSSYPFWTYVKKINTFTFWCMVIPLGPRSVYT